MSASCDRLLLFQCSDNLVEKTKKPALYLNEDGKPAVPPRLAQYAHLPECARTGYLRLVTFDSTITGGPGCAYCAMQSRFGQRLKNDRSCGEIRSGSQHPGFAGRRLAQTLFPSTPPRRVPRCGRPVNI